MVHACNPSYYRDVHRRSEVTGQLGQMLVRPYLKNKAGCGDTYLQP
jgi:hypothetical protein